MKKLSTYIVMLVMGLTTFSFSGCTEDQLIGMTNILHPHGGAIMLPTASNGRYTTK